MNPQMPEKRPVRSGSHAGITHCPYAGQVNHNYRVNIVFINLKNSRGVYVMCM